MADVQLTSSVPQLTRRGLLGGAVLAVAGLAVGAQVAQAADGEAEPSAESGVQYGFQVSSAHCVNCQRCVQACREVHDTPEDMPGRRKITTYESDYGMRRHVSTSCMHCEQPSCMQVCPARAISKRPDGIVVVDQGRCIGCKYCFEACPFSVPHYGVDGMDKCDYCVSVGVEPGQPTYCVQACIFDALHFGKMTELQERYGDMSLRVEGSTKPSMLVG